MDNLITSILVQIKIYIREHWFSLVVVVLDVVLRYGFTKIKFRYSGTPVKTYLTSLLGIIGVNAFLTLAYQEGLNSKYDDIIKVSILLGYFIYSINNEFKKENTEISIIILMFIKCYFITVISFSDTYFGIIIGSVIICTITLIAYYLRKKHDNSILKSKYYEIPLLCLELIFVFIICEQQTDLFKEILLSALITETIVFSYHPFALYVVKKLCHEDTTFYWESKMGYDEQ